MSTVQSPEQIHAEWIDRLNRLIDDVKAWAEELDWSTRRIEITLDESPKDKYKVPALLLQQEALKMLLEPIGSSTPGSEGRVDLYLMPVFDDIATMCYVDGVWQVYYMFPGLLPDKELHDEPMKLLSRETLQEVLQEMKKNAG
ncbi:MAG: hypothetical protein IT426_14455 [Pirellulales bacterium]|nr:hypothetical protein [Pirellulales bacterium]